MDNKTKKPRDLLAAALNLSVTVCGAIGLSKTIVESEGDLGLLFSFYTTLSNCLAMLICLVLAAYFVRRYINGGEIPRWVTIVKYMATCVLCITFLVVVFILVPQFSAILNIPMGEGFKLLLFSGGSLYHHFVDPVLCFAALVLFDRLPYAPKKSLGFALIPTLAYAAVAIPLNILRIWHGPYPFLYVYEQPVWMSFVWFFVVVGGAALISFFVAKAAKHE